MKSKLEMRGPAVVFVAVLTGALAYAMVRGEVIALVAGAAASLAVLLSLMSGKTGAAEGMLGRFVAGVVPKASPLTAPQRPPAPPSPNTNACACHCNRDGPPGPEPATSSRSATCDLPPL
jgi:hypothetical protein